MVAYGGGPGIRWNAKATGNAVRQGTRPSKGLPAFKLYRKAAEQGNADAQLNLGAMLDKGQGVAQDYAEAAKWWRRAAEQDSLAQRNLGWHYARGDGLPQDFVQAYMWLARRRLKTIRKPKSPETNSPGI